MALGLPQDQKIDVDYYLLKSLIISKLLSYAHPMVLKVANLC